MSLLKQLLLSVTIAIAAILTGVLAFSIDAARTYLDGQLQSESDNTASALALLLSQSAPVLAGETLERAQVRGRDRERSPPRQLDQDRLRERCALGRVGTAADLVDQHDRRLVPVFGLAADVADRLVEEDRDLCRLLAPCPSIHLDAVVVADLQADRRDLSVHTHPASGDPVIGLTP